MIEIKLGNSHSKITGMDAKLEKELKKLLSYTESADKAYFRGGFGPKRIPLMTKGEFPTGLIFRLKAHLAASGIVFKLIDERIVPKTDVKYRGQKPGVNPYPDQQKALLAAMTAHQGTIEMPTGSGKSMVIALIASNLGVKTLVVVPTLEIKQQLTKSLHDTLRDSSHVTVENIDSPRLDSMSDFDCLIIDEAHRSAAKTYRKLNKTAWNKIYYRFFTTATPFRNDADENILLESIAGKVIYRLTYKEAVAKGYIVPVEAYYINVPKIITDAYTWAEVYKELVVNNAVRNNIIINLLDTLHKSKKSTLCLVKEIEHGNNLLGFPFVNGETVESRSYISMFNDRTIDVLIGTTGILGEGIDTKPCEYVIIAGLGKAKSQLMQQVGRAVRTYPDKGSAKVIIFRDTSHKFTLRHFNEQKKILLEEYGIRVVELKV